MARKTSRDVYKRKVTRRKVSTPAPYQPPPTPQGSYQPPPTPAIVSQPPTPTVTTAGGGPQAYIPVQTAPPYQGTQVGNWLAAAGEQGLGADTQAGRWLGVAEALGQPPTVSTLPGQPGRWLAAELGSLGSNQVSRWMAAAGAPYGPQTGTGAPGMYPSPSDWWSGPTQGSWGTTSVDPYLFDDPGGGGGGGGGYGYAPAPRRYYTGGGQAAMRGTQQGYSTGLVNWRIGI